jgi:hypothetical protein
LGTCAERLRCSGSRESFAQVSLFTGASYPAIELFQRRVIPGCQFILGKRLYAQNYWGNLHGCPTSLLSSMLDDDPIIQAEIEMLVRTVDGQETPVTLILWEYGLLTPWATYLSGDGWKIDRLCLNEPSF